MALNDTLILTLVGSTDFENGESYYKRGAVRNTRQRGNMLLADVEGSQPKSYKVMITLAQGSIAAVRCTCPQASGTTNYCKHIAAVLIAYVRVPTAFEVRPEPANMIKNLSLEQSQQLWQNLVLQHPEMVDWLDMAITALTTKVVPQPKRQSLIDEKAYRRRIAQILRATDYSQPYETIWGVVEQLQEIEDQARAFLDNNDGQNALTILTIMAEAVIPKYEILEDETQLSDYLSGWSTTMAEAILSVDLSPKEKVSLQKQLADWRSALAEYSTDEALDLAQAALEQITQPEPDQPGWYEDELGELRLKIAERTLDAEAYLALCLHAGAHFRYAHKLMALGRIAEARDHALHYVARADEAFVLAQGLQAINASEQALEMGLFGLTLNEHKYELGKWLAVYAESISKNDVALKGWQAAFTERPELVIYQHIKRLAGSEWATLQPVIMLKLEAVAARGDVRTLIEVLLVENEVDRAVDLWNKSAWKDYKLLPQLVTAASLTHPDWAIRELLAQANDQINRGSTHYGTAANWLKQLKAVYAQHNRLSDWTICIDNIRAVNQRKRNLIPLLKGL